MMRIAAFAALLTFSSCKKTPSPSTSKPEPTASLTMPAGTSEKAAIPVARKELDAVVDADQRLADKNRLLMISPARADFKPEPVARKIRLNLVLEKIRIKTGEIPRFRLELTNVGRESINYVEYASSVFRWGGLFDSITTIKFMMIAEDGKRRRLQPSLALGRAQPVTPRNGPFSPEEEAASKASTTFQVKIQSGETLRSLGDGDSATEPFRKMIDREGFKVPGRYRIQVELDDRPGPLTANYIKLASAFQTPDETRKEHAKRVADALGPITSNTVVLEVLR